MYGCEECIFERGDINGSGENDYLDMMYVLRAIGSISKERDPIDGIDWLSSMGYYDLRTPRSFVTYIMVDIIRDGEIDLLDLMMIFDLINGIYAP